MTGIKARLTAATAFAFLVFLIGGLIGLLLLFEVFGPESGLLSGLAGGAIAAGWAHYSGLDNVVR